MRTFLRLAWIVAFVVIGAVIALVLYILFTWIEVSGYLEGWDELPPAPSGAVELLADELGVPYVRTSSGETYRYTRGTGDECWVKDEPSQGSGEVDEHIEITQPCDFSSPELSRFRSAVNVIDCVQIYIPEPEGFVKRAYVLDQDGRVWHWSHVGGMGYDITTVFACTSVSGGIVGLVVGIETSRWVFRKRRT